MYSSWVHSLSYIKALVKSVCRKLNIDSMWSNWLFICNLYDQTLSLYTQSLFKVDISNLTCRQRHTGTRARPMETPRRDERTKLFKNKTSSKAALRDFGKFVSTPLSLILFLKCKTTLGLSRVTLRKRWTHRAAINTAYLRPVKQAQLNRDRT